MSIEKIRKTGIMILACAFGMVIIQLAAPIILGILVQGIALVVPLAVCHFFVKGKWSLKLVQGEVEAHGERQEKSETSEEDMTESSRTAAWYEEVGKDKIMAVAMRLMKKDVGEFWIRKDGICNFRTGKGYRRAGTIAGFSDADWATLVRLLNDEGFMAEDQGKYLYLAWGV